MKVGYSKFRVGLKEQYDLSTEDLNRFKYVGDNYSNKGLRNWKNFSDEELPSRELECVCGHSIFKNAYISDGEELLILGTKCIQHFTPNGLKQHCKSCNEPHRRTKSEFCKACDPTIIPKKRKANNS